MPAQADKLSGAQVRRLVMVVLPLPTFDAAALAVVAYYQRHKRAAYHTARKRTLATLEQACAP